MDIFGKSIGMCSVRGCSQNILKVEKLERLLNFGVQDVFFEIRLNEVPVYVRYILTLYGKGDPTEATA